MRFLTLFEVAPGSGWRLWNCDLALGGGGGALEVVKAILTSPGIGFEFKFKVSLAWSHYYNIVSRRDFGRKPPGYGPRRKTTRESFAEPAKNSNEHTLSRA